MERAKGWSLLQDPNQIPNQLAQTMRLLKSDHVWPSPAPGLPLPCLVGNVWLNGSGAKLQELLPVFRIWFPPLTLLKSDPSGKAPRHLASSLQVLQCTRPLRHSAMCSFPHVGKKFGELQINLFLQNQYVSGISLARGANTLQDLKLL